MVIYGKMSQDIKQKKLELGLFAPLDSKKYLEHYKSDAQIFIQ